MKKLLFDKVNDILKKRKNLLEQQFKDACLTKDNALKIKDEYELALQSAKDVSDQIVADAKINARIEYEKIVKEADVEAQKLMETAKKNIEWEHIKTLRKMKSEIADLAMDVASKIVGENSTAESNQKLYDKFLEEAGELDGTNGY